MQNRCNATRPLRINRYPVASSKALAVFNAALTPGRSDSAIKESYQEISGSNIRIRKTHRSSGVTAMSPNVARSNLRCMK